MEIEAHHIIPSDPSVDLCQSLDVGNVTTATITNLNPAGEKRPNAPLFFRQDSTFFQEARRNVSRDSFVEVQRAFYEAPPEYIGRQVWVRWDSRCVRIFNERREQLQIHARLEAGKFSRILGVAGMRCAILAVRRSC